MWFVILKTLPPKNPGLPEDPGAGSAQPEMLLVADDANAAYSNPRPLPKCAQTLLPCISLSLPHLNALGCHRPQSAGLPPTLRFKKHIHACRAPVVATLDDMGYRGDDVSTAHGEWGRQTPWQQPPSGAAPGNAGTWDDGSQG